MKYAKPRRPNVLSVEHGGEPVDLKLFLSRLLKDWWIFAICVLGCVSIAHLYILSSTPLYKINAEILVEDEKVGPESLLVSNSSLAKVPNNLNNKVELLKATPLLAKVVRRLQLHISYHLEGALGRKQIFEAPFKIEIVTSEDEKEDHELLFTKHGEHQVDISYQDRVAQRTVTKKIAYNQASYLQGIGVVKVTRSTIVPFYEGDSYHVQITTIEDKAVGLKGDIEVVNPDQTTLLKIILKHPAKEEGERILSAFIDTYLQENVRNKNQIADSTIAFIDQRLLLVGQELGDVESKIQDFKQHNKLTNLPAQSMLLVNDQNSYQKELSKLDAEISVFNALEDYLKDDSMNKRVVPGAVLPTNPIFAGLVSQYNALLLDRDSRLLTSTDYNPFVANIDQQLSKLRNDILANLINAREVLVINQKELKANTQKIAGHITAVPAQERVFLDLTRQQQTKQDLYLFLLQKREEIAISKTSNISDYRVVEPPKADEMPFSPQRGTIYLVALMIGCTIPISRFLIVDFMNERVLQKEDVHKRTQVPIIAEVSLGKSGEDPVLSASSRSSMSEQFRVLRTNLHFFIKPETEKVILVTSSMPGEGKSFTAINLAKVLALSGKKVLLMELDLRKPSVSSNLRVVSQCGFTNFIVSDHAKLQDITTQVNLQQDSFDLIPSGPIPPNPAEVLMHERMQVLMEQVRCAYDFIVIDSPPIGVVTDAQVLSAYTDLTLYLVRQKVTLKEHLEIPEEIFVHKRMNKIAIVLNGVSHLKGYGYYQEEEPVGFAQKILQTIR